jgi:hypothetical protein
VSRVLDGPLQDIVGREADGIRQTPSLQRFIEGRESKGRVGADDHGLSPGPVPVNDGEEHLIPPVSTVDVARSKRGGQAREPLVVPLLSEEVRLEPVERRGERDARLFGLTRGQHPEGGILGQSLGVVGVLVARQAAIDGLAE